MNIVAKCLAVCVLAGLAPVSGAVLAGDTSVQNAREAPPRHCLSLIRIKNSYVLDKNSILFKTVNNEYYVNRLPHACPGLTRTSPIMYRTSLNELCDLDIITVLDNTGFGLLPQASCGLGLFSPVSEAEALALKKARQ